MSKKRKNRSRRKAGRQRSVNDNRLDGEHLLKVKRSDAKEILVEAVEAGVDHPSVLLIDVHDEIGGALAHDLLGCKTIGDKTVGEQIKIAAKKGENLTLILALPHDEAVVVIEAIAKTGEKHPTQNLPDHAHWLIAIANGGISYDTITLDDQNSMESPLQVILKKGYWFCCFNVSISDSDLTELMRQMDKLIDSDEEPWQLGIEGGEDEPRHVTEIPDAIDFCQRLIEFGFIWTLPVSTALPGIVEHYGRPLDGFGAFEVWATATGNMLDGGDITEEHLMEFELEFRASKIRYERVCGGPLVMPVDGQQRTRGFDPRNN